MKVLFVSPSWHPQEEFGGPIFTTKRLKDELEGILLRQLYVASYGMDWRKLPKFLSDLWAIVRLTDIVHLTGVYNASTIPTLLACRYFRKPLVWSPRGALQRWPGSRKVWVKAVWHRLCRVSAGPARVALHCTSEREAAESAKVFRWPIRVIPNGVDVPATICRPAQLAHRYKLVYVGRLDAKKNLEFLLNVCSCFQFSYELCLAGTGEPKYVQQLHALSGRINVTFYGHLPHDGLSDFLADADLFLYPSETENFGQAIGEALAHGVPVIASPHVPFDLNKHGCGINVPLDRTIWALTIASVLSVPGGRSLFGENGRRWMREEYNWKDRAQEMLALYEWLSSVQAAGT